MLLTAEHAAFELKIEHVYTRYTFIARAFTIFQIILNNKNNYFNVFFYLFQQIHKPLPQPPPPQQQPQPLNAQPYRPWVISVNQKNQDITAILTDVKDTFHVLGTLDGEGIVLLACILMRLSFIVTILKTCNVKAEKVSVTTSN